MKKIDLIDLKRYYNETFYDSKTRYSRKSEDYKVFVDYLRPERGSSLLDVSCGTGLLLKAAEDFYDCQTFGIDLSERAIFEAKDRLLNSNLQLANGEALPYKDKIFDFVTNIGSLEHYLNPDKGLDELIRVCKPGGRLCIVLPNYYYLLNILCVFWKGDHLKGHQQINEKLDTLKGWLRFLNRKELTVEKILKDKGPKQTSIFEHKNPLRILKRVFKRFILLVTPLNLTYQFVFICKKTKPKKNIV
jgi:SAM-dependent methyltransferase